MTYHRFYNEFQALIDSISHDSDPAQKLNNLQRLYKDGMTLILNARDEAAYEIRSNYSSEDAEQLAQVSRKYIDYWARRYMKRNALPPLKQRRRIDLSNVRDLSGFGASQRP